MGISNQAPQPFTVLVLTLGANFMRYNRVTPPRWKALFEAAFLEPDFHKFAARMAEAQDAITSRFAELDSADARSRSERDALDNAQAILRHLLRFAESENGRRPIRVA